MLPFAIERLAGGFIESFAIGSIFYGIAISQGYVYFRSCERDPLWIKCMAGSVLILETVHTAFFLRQMYFYTVLTIENPLNIVVVDWSIPICLILEIVIEMVVDIFYIHRVWSFSKNVALTFSMVVVLIARHGIFLFTAGETVIHRSWAHFETPTLKGTIVATLCLVAILDITVAVTMVYYLNRSKAAIGRTKGIITWLMMYYVNTGVLMATLAIAIVIAYLAAPGSLLFAGFINVFAKVMANTLFGALNSRQLLRAKMVDPIIIDTNAYMLDQSSCNTNSIRVKITQKVDKTPDPLDRDETVQPAS